MTYAAGRQRLFSCGVGQSDSTLVEWSEEDGQVLTRFVGFVNKAEAAVRMAVAADRFLLVPDDGVVKVGGGSVWGCCVGAVWRFWLLLCSCSLEMRCCAFCQRGVQVAVLAMQLAPPSK